MASKQRDTTNLVVLGYLGAGNSQNIDGARTRHSQHRAERVVSCCRAENQANFF
jgi:hypothetical protein